MEGLLLTMNRKGCTNYQPWAFEVIPGVWRFWKLRQKSYKIADIWDTI
jgi:hypothetical protein